jgi:hypothetical protein
MGGVIRVKVHVIMVMEVIVQVGSEGRKGDCDLGRSLLRRDRIGRKRKLGMRLHCGEAEGVCVSPPVSGFPVVSDQMALVALTYHTANIVTSEASLLVRDNSIGHIGYREKVD